MKKHFLACFILFAAVWLLYFQTWDFEFLRLDDHDYTFRCAFVKDGFSFQNLLSALTSVRHAAIWMPATYVSYMFDISLFGPSMTPHHLVNVVIHACNAGLLYLLLIGIVRGNEVKSGLLAFAAAMFWAVHPQRVEAVAWIAGRKELLWTFWTLIGLLVWLYCTKFRLIGSALCCLLACMSKPTGMCFPFLAFAIDLICGRKRGQSPGKWISSYLFLLPISIFTGMLAVYSQTHPAGMEELSLYAASFWWRMLNAGVAAGLSVFHAIVPTGIHLDYRAVPENFPIGGMTGLVSFGVMVILFAAAMVKWRENRNAVLAVMLFAAVAMIPTFGIFGSFGEHARADRFFYLPSMAISMGIVLGCRRYLKRVSIPLICAAVFFMISAFPVVGSYRNDYTAFKRTLMFDPDNGRALAHVASEECARFGRIDRGIELFRRSREVRPRDDTAAQLAYALMMRARPEDYAEIRRLCAKFACDHSLDKKGMALEALGITHMRCGRYVEAAACLESSINAPRRFYSSSEARRALKICHEKTGAMRNCESQASDRGSYYFK